MSTLQQAMSSWSLLGPVAPAGLAHARDTVHWAMQIVAAAGATLTKPQSDASHTNLEWLGSVRAFAGVEGPDRYRAALRLTHMRLWVLGAGERVVDELPLVGRTMGEGLEWLGGALARARRVPASALVLPKHELPDHPLAHGATFDVRALGPALEALAEWYANSDLLLRALARETPGASPVRVWPHHFDIATLIAVDPTEKDSEKRRTIGVGTSPGDTSYAEPYLYVTPWPRPKERSLPPIEGGGVWHETGWFGAVLLRSTLSAATSREEQTKRIIAFVRSATSACRGMLESKRS